MIKQTSIDAFNSLKDLGERQQEVYNAISSLGEVNNREIAEFLKLPINFVVPRTNELVKFKLVKESRKVVDSKTNRKTIAWRVV